MYGIRRQSERLELEYKEKMAEVNRLKKKKTSKKKLEDYLKSQNRQFDY